MAGGSWDAQNKIQPGIYINFKSSPSAIVTIGERGIVAIARELDWGEAGGINVINSINDVYTKLGYDINSSNMLFARQMFLGSNRGTGASRLLVYRLPTSGGVAATGDIGDLSLTAKYPGIRGNDITVIVSPDIDSEVAEPSIGTATLTLTDNNSANVAGAVISLEVNNNSSWEASTFPDETTSATGTVTFSELPVGEYRFALASAPSGYDSASIQFAPATFEIIEGGGAQTIAVNGAIAETDETVTAPTAPENPTDPVADTFYAVWVVETVVDGIIQNSQTVGSFTDSTDYTEADISDLVNNDWVNFSGSGKFTASAGTALTGGVTGTTLPAGYSTFLTALEPYTFTVLCYDGTDPVVKSSYRTFVNRLGYDYGRYSQMVCADYMNADDIMVSSVQNGFELTDGTILSPEQATWWFSGVMASATGAETMTYASHPEAVMPVPVLQNIEVDEIITRGGVAFIVEFGAVKIVTDINTFTSYTVDKGKVFNKNRTIRTLFGFANGVYEDFSRYYIGQVDNTPEGRDQFKVAIIARLLTMEGAGEIQNVQASDVEVLPGNDPDSIVVNVYIQVVNAIEKVYMTVTVTVDETVA